METVINQMHVFERERKDEMTNLLRTKEKQFLKEISAKTIKVIP